jgi:hypothetical protein
LGRLQRAGLASGGGGRCDSNAGETVARPGQHAAQGGSIGPREEVGSFEWCRTRVEGKLTEVASMAYGGARCCARARSTASFFYRRADRRWGNASSLSIHSEYAMGTACAGTSARAQQVGGATLRAHVRVAWPVWLPGCGTISGLAREADASASHAWSPWQAVVQWRPTWRGASGCTPMWERGGAVRRRIPT